MGNQSGGMKKNGMKKGGALTENDIEQINDLIDKKLLQYGFKSLTIPIDDNEISNDKSIHSDETSGIFASSIHNDGTSGIFAKANIELKKQIDLKRPKKTDSYFHIIKLTDENTSKWNEFEATIKRVTPRFISKKINNWRDPANRIALCAGFDYFNPHLYGAFKEKGYDLYVAYASNTLNKSILPPDWINVECMVTVITKKDIPMYSNMGLTTLAHTFSKEYQTPYNFDGPDIVFGKYESHKYISMYLFTFIGTTISHFYSNAKEALLTSPTESVHIVVSKVFDANKLIYGQEIMVANRNKTNSLTFTIHNTPDSAIMELPSDKLEQLCPWYNRFEAKDVGKAEAKAEVEAKDEAIDAINYICMIEPFIYIPTTSFEQLAQSYKYEFI
jgi:hypothetical protein